MSGYRFLWHLGRCSLARDFAYKANVLQHRYLVLHPNRVSPSRKCNRNNPATQVTRAKIYNNDLRYGRRTYIFKFPFCATRPAVGIFKRINQYIPSKVQ